MCRAGERQVGLGKAPDRGALEILVDVLDGAAGGREVEAVAAVAGTRLQRRGARGLGQGVEVEPVGAVDQDELDRDVVCVVGMSSRAGQGKNILHENS